MFWDSCSGMTVFYARLQKNYPRTFCQGNNNWQFLQSIIIVHPYLPSFRALIFFTSQAQSRFKQAAIV